MAEAREPAAGPAGHNHRRALLTAIISVLVSYTDVFHNR